ncbi:hypothetical protein D9756_002888 [Leucocoprinus leucothites]|uniref:Beta-glucuronidase C-terminal domain-containing protein n=1 Tax=Leucocoprinus leucothites TaxID=201217 RepID=A0A8H5G6D2_9AGAR|nr:hypothetical protein D9756_002888 [Leucoagaricus leucothites]
MLPLSLVLAVPLFVVLTYAGAPINVTFPSKPPSEARDNVIDDNFIGISWELSSFDTLWGKSVEAQPNAMQNYLHNLIVRLSKPLRIRVGGNSMDGSTYVPSLQAVLELTDPNAYFNDVPVNFGPALFDVMNGMSDKAGDMEFMIGLSMRNPEAWGNIVELALAAEGKLGDRLDAMLLGNEPDLYAGHGERDKYTIPDYIPEIADVLGELRDSGALSKTIIGGPSICCQWDLDDLFDAGFDKFDYKYYTVQHYPNNACSGETPQNTNLTYYLTHANLGEYLGWQKKGMHMARQRNIPVLMSEYNSVSCGGSNISSTFGAALWAIDAGLKAAAMNYSAVYLHTREYGVEYNLFDPPTPDTSTLPGWRTGSTYYSALFLAEIGDSSGSVVVDLNLQNSTENQHSTVAGYGIYGNGGETRSHLVFFNYASPSSAGEDTTQQFRIPANLSNHVDYRILTAPDVTERTDIKWAGQTVGPNGDLEGDQQTVSFDCDDGCLIDIPGPGAAIVWLDSDGKLFTGNSTIAPYQYLSDGDSARPGSSRTFVLLTIILGVLTFFA